MQLRIFNAVVLAAVVLSTQGCSSAGGEDRGHEFMPDMAHSTAYEANLYDYYFYNTWGTEEEYKKFVMPREPVNGTIPRGYTGAYYTEDMADRVKTKENFAGVNSPTGIAYTANGHVPYYYEDTEEERTRAMAEIIDNPYPITENGLAHGKELYTVYCGICHGDKADGLGFLVREANPGKGVTAGVYPAAPANFQQKEFYEASNGRYYHAIMYGKNVMGSHADKLSYEERWQVIHYIRSLQAKEQGLVYSEEENTFTNDTPGSMVVMDAEEVVEMGTEEHGGDQADHGGH
jgi:mono/diheme cytochrome c family protein